MAVGDARYRSRLSARSGNDIATASKTASSSKTNKLKRLRLRRDRGSEKAIEFAALIQRNQVVAATDVLLAYEDLRHSPPL